MKCFTDAHHRGALLIAEELRARGANAMKLAGSEFRLFVDECLACANEATTDEGRRHHLAMAKMWSTAAGRLESSDSASQVGRSGERKHPASAWENHDH